jgi:flagellar protein FliO/FliZ
MTAYDYLKFFLALVFVLALMGGLSLVLKRLGLGAASMLPPDKRRLKILEILPLDSRRKAVLLERDDVTHLVILSQTGETVVETNIQGKHV